MTACTPSQAALSELGSRRSPSTTVAPRRLRFSTFAGADEARTSALTGLPDAASKRQISVPTIPVDPTTRFIGPSPACRSSAVALPVQAERPASGAAGEHPMRPFSTGRPARRRLHAVVRRRGPLACSALTCWVAPAQFTPRAALTIRAATASG